MEHRARAKKEQRLEEPVVPDVQETTGEGEPAPGGVAIFHRHECEPEAKENDADVFDAVVGEQALEIVLAERERHAEHRARRAEGDDHPAGAVGHRQPAAETDQAVESDLNGDAGEDRGDMARSVGVRRRQPHVERKKTGLEPEANQREPEQRRELLVVGQRTERPVAVVFGQQREEGEEREHRHV